MEQAAAFIIAAVPCLVIARGFFGGVDPYQAFVGGAKEGMQQAAALFPALAAMMLMLETVSLSGLDTLIMHLLAPVTSALSLPEAVAPVMLLRPLTGSGSLAALESVFEQHGPDSPAGVAASVLCASTETVFYTLTVYLSAAGVKHLPLVIPVSLLSGLAGAWVLGMLL